MTNSLSMGAEVDVSSAVARVESPACYRLLFNPASAWGAPALLLLAALLPPAGLGIPVCLFRALSGLPCPGCGLTRALVALLHGDLAAAFVYHPYSFVLLPLLGIMSLHALLPAAAQFRLAEGFRRRERSLSLAYQGVLYSFLGFGILRLFLTWLQAGKLT